MRQFEVAVIGGGPGGYIAAIRAAQLGKKTVLIEKRDLGGTCLNRGCIPTKALLHSAEAYHALGAAKALGITLGEYSFQYKKMAKRKDKVVRQLRSGVENLVAGHGAELIRGEAVLTGPHTIRVGGEALEAEQIILAAGSMPAPLPVPGAQLPGVINSDGVLALEECPESLVIVGGGVIGVEFATLFSDLGRQVTILEMLPGILSGSDPDVCRAMTGLLEDKGVRIYTGAKLLGITEGLTCTFEQEGRTMTVQGEAVVLAAGRKPDSAGLGLEAAGVAVQRGFIPVDGELRTNVPHIFAIGDLTGKQQLAHVATAQGIVAAHNAAGEHRGMCYDAVPGCIYTNPEIACVGLTEEKAEAVGYKVRVGRFNVSGNGRSLAIGCQDGFAKLVADAETGKVLGCHILAPHATEIIAEATLAIQNGLGLEALAGTIHAHPTVSEIIMEAAHDAQGLCCHKM
ncbi:dihydrolipoyl dehydrogenase [Oscillospiraceae bacterium]|nr:dihydrolipoyl dehydrogenase [Oscillospiraceae bacterium]BDF76627.1 dihydrolipoyl dehydrogenase [Oscillospiraceae bacterium]